MSGSVSKHRYKVYLKEENRLPAEFNRKIAWSVEAGDSHLYYSSGRDCSDLEANDALEYNDGFEWPSRGSFPERRGKRKDDNISKDFIEILETGRERCVRGSYNNRMSPGLDERGLQNHGWSPKNIWRQLRSHSRTRTRSQSQSRSRSPVQSCRRESCGWSGRIKSGSGILSQPCKDFAAGRCWRASECRFLHQDSHSYRDSRQSEIDPAESRVSRQEFRGASRSGNIEGFRNYLHNEAYRGYGNSYDGDSNGPPRNSRRYTNHCNNFTKGDGGSVRHGAFGNGYDRRKRNTAFSYEHERESHRNSDTLCNYFAPGKFANDDYRRFPHDDSEHSSPERRSWDDRWGYDLDDENKSWDSSEWTDANAVLEIAMSTEYGNNHDRKRKSNQNSDTLCKYFAMGKCRNGNYCMFSHDVPAHSNHKGKPWGNRCDHDLDDENKLWGDNYDHKHKRHRSTDTMCKYFATGKCRDGSYCMFLHDGPACSNSVVRSRNESLCYDFDDKKKPRGSPKWNNATAVSDIAKSTENQDRHKPNRSSLCKYFVIGICRDGDNCRFSHDSPTLSNPKGRSWDDILGHDLDDKNTSCGRPKWKDATAVPDIVKSNEWDNSHDGECGPHQSSNTICKYFAMGKICISDHCKFTHDGPAHSNSEGRSWDERKRCNLNNEKKSRGSVKWNNATAVPNIEKSIEWGNSRCESHNGPVPEVRSCDDRKGHDLDDDNKSCVSSKRNDATAIPDIAKSTEWGNDHSVKCEPHWSSDILCKYFATGKCFNGNSCRFSHDDPAHSNPGERSWDDKWSHVLDDKNISQGSPTWDNALAASNIAKSNEWGNNRDLKSTESGNQSWNGKRNNDLDDTKISLGSPKWDDGLAVTNTAKSNEWSNNHKHESTGLGNKSWGSSKWTDASAVLDTAKSTKRGNNHNEKRKPHRSSDTLCKYFAMGKCRRGDYCRLSHDGLAHGNPNGRSQNYENKSERSPKWNDAIVVSEVAKSTGQGNNNIENTNFTDPTGAENSTYNSCCHSFGNENILSGGVVWNEKAAERDKHQHSGSGSSGANKGFRESEVKTESSVKERPRVFQHTLEGVSVPVGEKNTTLETSGLQLASIDVHPTAPGTSNVLQHFSNIESPVSFSGQSFKQDGDNSSSQPPSRFGPSDEQAFKMNEPVQTAISPLNVKHLQFVQGNSAETPEMVEPLTSTGLMLSVSSSGNKIPCADLKAVQLNPVILSHEQHDSIGNVMDSSEHDESRKLPQQSIAYSETRESSRRVPGDSKQGQESAHSEYGKVEEGNRTEDENGVLVFRIALVEFVKEILKPAWKEGRLSKEIHKIIVKKVVDKVIGSVQGVHVPKTKEAIDHFLSYSNPKITKLVQAYIEIYPKSKTDA